MTSQNKTQRRSSLTLKRTHNDKFNLGLSIIALLLSLYVETAELNVQLYPLDKIVGGLSLVCIVVSVLLTNTIIGKERFPSWQFWQPFTGGWRFVCAQSAGWTLLSISLLLAGISLRPEDSVAILGGKMPATWAAAGILGFLAQLLMILSLTLYEIPKTPRSQHTVRWNDVGIANMVVSIVSVMIAVICEHFKLLPEQLNNHLVIATLAVMCLVNAVLITRLLIGGIYSSNWRKWPWGGWRFALMQVISWSLFASAIVFGAWSMRYTTVKGTWTLTGAVGFVAQLIMVVSIHTYVIPPLSSETEAVKKDAFASWLNGSRDLAYKARVFLVTAMLFNCIYAPLVPAFVGPILSLAPAPYFWQIATVACLVAAAYLVGTFLPRPEVTGRFDSERGRKSFLVTDIMRYFSGKVVKTAELDCENQYIFGLHPHGIIPSAAVWSHNSEEWKELFNGPPPKTVTLIASHLFRIPLLREILAVTGAREVTQPVFTRALKEGKSVLLVPGGMHEMQFSSSKDENIVVCTRHKGFIKMALRHGTTLVPVFSFGETKLLDCAFPPLQRLFWRWFGIPFPLFIGRWGLPMPRPTTVTVAVGPPIKMTKIDNPTSQQVEDAAAIYFAALKDVFESNKVRVGYPEATLILNDE